MGRIFSSDFGFDSQAATCMWSLRKYDSLQWTLLGHPFEMSAHQSARDWFTNCDREASLLLRWKIVRGGMGGESNGKSIKFVRTQRRLRQILGHLEYYRFQL